MAEARAEDVVAELHAFGLTRDRFRSAMVTALGIGLSDIDALEYLERLGPMTQRELGAQLSLSSGGVTVLVDRLEQRGLVRRSAHPTDRRVAVIELAASAALPEVPEIDGYHRSLAAAARRLTSGQRQTVMEFLRTATSESERAAAGMHKRAAPS